MKHYVGLDVSVKETFVCILDETGKVCREVKVPSHPQDIVQVLKDTVWQVERIGLEAGPLSQWLFSGLAEAGLPVVCIETRTHYTPPDIGVGFPFLTVTNMKANGLDLVGASKISECEFRKAAAQNCAPIEGDILFSKDGTVGKVWVVRAVQPFAVLSSIAIIRPDTRQVFPEYLAHFLRTPQSLATAAQRKTGSAPTRIILKDIRNLRVPLPSLDEQKRIAAILDQADEIRGLRQSAIDRLDVLGQAIFYEMFGDPVKNPKGWDDRRTLGDASDIVSGITKGRKLNGKPTREVPYLAVVNVQDRELRLDPLKMIEATEGCRHISYASLRSWRLTA